MVVIWFGAAAKQELLMAKREIITVWNDDGTVNEQNLEFLIQPTESVNFPLCENDEIVIQDLKDTAAVTSCAGIAANQIGYKSKIFIGCTEFHSNEYNIYINPEIVEYSKRSMQKYEEIDSMEPGLLNKFLMKRKNENNENEISTEGCLSIPGFAMGFNRYNEIKVKYNNENGDEIEQNLYGYLSTVFQHETDHINGILIADRVIPALKEKEGEVIAGEYPFESLDADLIGKKYKQINIILKKLAMYDICPYVGKTNIVPFSKEYQYFCNSELYKSKCDHLVNDYCFGQLRNYKNCQYFSVTGD